jgi:hypothetical protein
MATRKGTIGSNSSSNETPAGERGHQEESVLEEAQEVLADTAARARDKAGARVDSERSKLADQIGVVTQALRDGSSEIRDNDKAETVARYVDTFADQTERLADYVSAKSPRDMLADLESFARREPALFLGGAFTLGLIASRLLKSSAQTSSGASSARSSPQGGVRRTGSSNASSQSMKPREARPTGTGASDGNRPNSAGGPGAP